MKDSEPIKPKAHWKFYLWGIFVFVFLCILVALILPCFRPISFNIGDNFFSMETEKVKPGTADSERTFDFDSVSWDGPTGEYSNGNVYRFKAWNLIYTINFVTDPLAAARSRLPSDIPGLVKALDDTNWAMQSEASEALINKGISAKTAIPELIARLDRENETLKQVLQKLSSLDTEYSIPLLIQCSTNKSETARKQSVEILGELGPSASNAIPAIVTVLRQDSPKSQLIAAQSIAKIDNKVTDPVPVLVGLLGKDQREIRIGATVTLGEFGPLAGQAAPALLPFVKSSDNELRKLAIRTLGLIGSPNADGADQNMVH